MSKAIDLTGQKFGRLTVIQRAENRNGKTMWMCQCDCGNEKITQTMNLTHGDTKSCGCLQKETIKEIASTHKKSKTKLYRVYLHIKERCSNPSSKSYSDYGGRGISVCDEWLDSYEKFMDWSYENGYKDGLQIDRMDNDGNYEPSNCRWTDRVTQANNRRNNNFIEFNGEKRTLSEWEKETGIGQSTIWARIYKLNWSIEKALTTPVRGGNSSGEKR